MNREREMKSLAVMENVRRLYDLGWPILEIVSWDKGVSVKAYADHRTAMIADGTNLVSATEQLVKEAGYRNRAHEAQKEMLAPDSPDGMTESNKALGGASSRG